MFATDSSNYGYGGYHGHDWFAGGWYSAVIVELDDHAHCVGTAVQYKDSHINVKELWPILVAIRRWGRGWRNSKVICESDNTQVVWAVNTSRKINELSMSIL